MLHRFDPELLDVFHMVNFRPVNEFPQIIRSRRKTYSIEIHPDGRVVVRVPQRSSREQIEALLRAKASWIEKKLAQQQAIPSELQPKKFVEGERFDYLGESYPLLIVERAAKPLELIEEYFYLRRKDQPRAVQVFDAWYRARARAVITERVGYFAEQNGFTYRRIRISGARTRWGSCSTRGSLNFTWRLIQAPLPVVDYVVVHELAHLIVPNHSKNFWKLVERLLPEFATHRAWLKVHGRRLSV